MTLDGGQIDDFESGGILPDLKVCLFCAALSQGLRVSLNEVPLPWSTAAVLVVLSLQLSLSPFSLSFLLSLFLNLAPAHAHTHTRSWHT